MDMAKKSKTLKSIFEVCIECKKTLVKILNFKVGCLGPSPWYYVLYPTLLSFSEYLNHSYAHNSNSF